MNEYTVKLDKATNYKTAIMMALLTRMDLMADHMKEDPEFRGYWAQEYAEAKRAYDYILTKSSI